MLCFLLVNCEPEGGRKKCASTINGQPSFQLFIEWIGKIEPPFGVLGDGEARRVKGWRQALGKPVRSLRLSGGVSQLSGRVTFPAVVRGKGCARDITHLVDTGEEFAHDHQREVAPNGSRDDRILLLKRSQQAEEEHFQP